MNKLRSRRGIPAVQRAIPKSPPPTVISTPADDSPCPWYAGRNGVGSIEADRNARIRCLRVGFWGVQGSVPVAATGRGMLDYQEQTIEFAVRRLATVGHQPGMRSKLRRLLTGEADEKVLHAVTEALGKPPLPVYGGETTCVSVETDEGNMIVFDGGTGVRGLAADLDQRWANRDDRVVHLFGTHEHLDHRNGLPFSRLCYARPRPFDIKVYGTRKFLEALDDRYGIFTHRFSETVYYDDPVDYRMMSATFDATELRSPGQDLPVPWKTHRVDEPIFIGATRIDSFDVYHGVTRCLAYKITHRDRVFVFCTDHELRHDDGSGTGMLGAGAGAAEQARSEAAEAALRAACKNADLAYFDGQYLLPEYRGHRGIGSGSAVSRIDWGHGCIEDGIERARACSIRRTYLGHHDPERTWPERLKIDQMLKAQSVPGEMEIRLANDEEVIDL